ncbi:MAG TPA: LLM class flavin-dependent oxidoreductase [Chitinimonas sp.]
MIPFSVLDLSPVVVGATPADALRNTLDLAQHAERWGFHRYWLAEHHNMVGIASAATAVVLAHVAAGTRSIRVGSGGIMLPNHAPLVIAEQFGTLESLHPGRIDLGLGRAPGTDMGTARALRRDMLDSADRFPLDVQELQALLAPVRPGQAIQAVPGGGLEIPIWLLGSSLFSAQLAAAMGLPFAFASHFAPDYLMQALQIYREQFRPSKQLDRPYAMVAAGVVAADTDEEARYLFTSLQQQFTNLRRGTPGKIQPPIPDMAAYWQPGESLGVNRALACSAVGSRETVKARLLELIEQTGADELILTANIYEHAKRLRSFEILADIHAELSGRSLSW